MKSITKNLSFLVVVQGLENMTFLEKHFPILSNSNKTPDRQITIKPCFAEFTQGKEDL